MELVGIPTSTSASKEVEFPITEDHATPTLWDGAVVLSSSVEFSPLQLGTIKMIEGVVILVSIITPIEEDVVASRGTGTTI